jgi:hypothetical protein
VNSKRISADRAHAIVVEDIAAEDWNEQLLVTVDTRKISEMSYTRTQLIKFAEAPSGAHTDERSED